MRTGALNSGFKPLAVLVLALAGCQPAVPAISPDQPLLPDPYQQMRIPKGTVVGRVLDAATGQGLAGVSIQVQNVEPAAVATSDATGSFMLPQVTQGKQIVVLEKAGYTAPPGRVIADVMPNTTITLAAIAMRPVVVVPSPTPSPRQWVRARFGRVHPNVVADTNDFDTEQKGEGGAAASGGVFATWREQNDYGKAHPRAFVVWASWVAGMAPPWAADRALELRFLAPPTAGQRFDLGTGDVTASRAQLRYLQGYRFRKDVWAATGGSLVVTPAEDGTVRVMIAGATMVPDPRGEDFHSEAAGTFDLTGEGVVQPQDQRGQAPPDPTPTPTPEGPDLNGIWTFALPGGTATPIPACGATYRQFVFEDADRDGRDVSIRVREITPPGSGTPANVSWLLTGGLVDGHYEFKGVMPLSGDGGGPSSVAEAFRLTYDEATGKLVGWRQVGASVAEGGRGALPVELERARFEAPPPEGCPSPGVR